MFALARIREGDVVEHCPVLVVEPPYADELASGALSGYVYDWGDGCTAVALGYGSLYNHDPDPNAAYSAGDDGETLVVVARRDIEAGDEVTIDYTGGGQVELWFDMDESESA